METTLRVVLLTCAIIAIIIRSGLPYRNLHYSSLLQLQVMDVPIVIPLTWLMMLPPPWAMTKLIIRTLSGCLLWLVFVLVRAMAFMAWCFYYDPLMINLGVLEWKPPGRSLAHPGALFWIDDCLWGDHIHYSSETAAKRTALGDIHARLADRICIPVSFPGFTWSGFCWLHFDGKVLL